MLNWIKYQQSKALTNKEKIMVVLKKAIRLLKLQLQKLPSRISNTFISLWRQYPIPVLFLILLLFYIQFQ